MLTLIALLAWLYFSARRVSYAESILQNNWSELSDEMKDKLVSNKRYDLYALMGLSSLLVMETIPMLLALVAAAQSAGVQ